MNMIFKYSWKQYTRMMNTNKLVFIHSILIVPGMGVIVYVLKDYLINTSEAMLNYVLYFMFLFQTVLIVGKRLKNEFFFSPRCFTIFPQERKHIFLYLLFFGIIDINVILMLLVTFGMIVSVINLNIYVIILFLSMFIICEFIYLLFMMVMIDLMTEKYGNSKNLLLVTFSLFFLLELFTRLAEKFYMFDFYPISGWIGSTVFAAIKGDNLQVLLYFGVTILPAIIGLFLLKKLSFPRKNNVF